MLSYNRILPHSYVYISFGVNLPYTLLSQSYSIVQSTLLKRTVTRGEQTALTLESNLTNLERKLDDFLAKYEEPERHKVESVDGNKTRSDADGKRS